MFQARPSEDCGLPLGVAVLDGFWDMDILNFR